ncbi:MAG: flagellar basal body-associated FliL family protein [Methylicorpusculum sp.]|uniref:flagellar basal body-associated FliL family protein n=1 Tax=Methylicorpusculum sp. TaxID=2713644 RepID=UPI002724E75F|nr:flagellar basal body-associated FliL family protein [Methylicorpusculum sp.]MDO8843567.1 flagellar basal body-associated FliL family protein [Methylicorpusculum sp.]MDO8937831.1 flagellar basal body-associated FliL family protein [Methylicorpusculum sp.]MDP2202582.1 flagellar basal body-associated FliL family protein [Methylicorpusculum sp.]MDP3528994.1 flagellar basal body-associated FliL family protein [Methylicorpusculum sp.]MDZ4151480.1 flagellar basal body-associated FliL family protei
MAEKAQPIEGEEKKSSKKLIIIIVILVLLIGGGAGAYFFLMGDSGAETEESIENSDKKAEKEGKADDEVDSAGVKLESLYYDMSKPLIVDFPRGSSIRLIQISVSLMVKGQETLDALKKHDPMIRNNLLMLISSQSGEDLASREGKEKLKEAMKLEVGNVLKKMSGSDRLKEVFFTAFVMQ